MLRANLFSMVDVEISVEIGVEALGVVQLASQAVTELLVKWRGGDQEALQALLPLVYKELRDIAHRQLRRERSGHTLQSTALVHEAWLRLAGNEQARFAGRAHFFAAAAEAMRHILIDSARRKRAARHGERATPGCSKLRRSFRRRPWPRYRAGRPCG